MSDPIDDLLDAEEKHNGPTCRISALDGMAKQIYERGLAQKRSATVIARAMVRAGYMVTHSTIQRHQSGSCVTCQRRG